MLACSLAQHGTVANAIAWGLEEPGRLSPSGHSWLNKARHARHSPHTGDAAPPSPPPLQESCPFLLGFPMQPRSSCCCGFDPMRWLFPLRLTGLMGFTWNSAAVKKFGQQCELPGSWESSFHAALSSQGLVEAVRKTIVAGGDNASRSGVLGALFGAQVRLRASMSPPSLRSGSPRAPPFPVPLSFPLSLSFFPSFTLHMCSAPLKEGELGIPAEWKAKVNR